MTPGRRLRIRTRLAGELGPGDSIAVNGVCLTATEVGAEDFAAQAMHETLERSSLGRLATGAQVNLELAAARARTGSAAMSSRATSTGRAR